MALIWNMGISGYDLVISVNELLVDVNEKNQFLLLLIRSHEILRHHASTL